jgi:hypothetical protein
VETTARFFDHRRGGPHLLTKKRSSPGVAGIGKRQVSISLPQRRCGVILATGEVSEMYGLEGDLFGATFQWDLCQSWIIIAFEIAPDHRF